MEATLDLVSCAGCGRQVARNMLVFDSGARLVCPSCEADQEIAAVGKRSFWQLVVGPPALAIIGSLGLCLPILNLFVPALLGLGAVIAGIAAFRTALRGNTLEGVTESNKVFLILAGVVGGLWGLGLIGMNALAWLGLALTDRTHTLL